MIHIRKYSNRKLYIQHQGVIDLTDITKFVLESQAFKVVDQQSGNDITVETLGAALLKTLQDIDCDTFDKLVVAIKTKRGWKQ